MIDTSTERARRLAADLTVLEYFDALREGWFDYGGGQRAKELSRRRRELRELVELRAAIGQAAGNLQILERRFGADELEQAFERVGRPRLRRLERESFRHGCRSTDRSIQCWRKTERHFVRVAA